VKEDEIGSVCSRHGERKCIWGFDDKARRKETTRKI
jgi:hypothetical protein